MATDKEVAAHLDVSDRTIRELRQRGVFPANVGRGGMDLDAARVAYIRHLRERAAGRSSDSAEDDDLDLVRERAREAKESADAKAMKNAMMRGQVIEKAPHTNAMIGFIEVSKARLLRVPAVMAGADAALRVKLQTAIEDALDELSLVRVEEAVGGGTDGEEEPEED